MAKKPLRIVAEKEKPKQQVFKPIKTQEPTDMVQVKNSSHKKGSK